MHVFGYMRFSFLGRNDTKVGRNIQDAQERARILYAPDRMEERFYFFEKITLPSIRAQTDQDFKLLIVSSPEMPIEYQNRLNTAVADIPQIRVIYSDEAHITYAIQPVLAEMIEGIEENTVHFRMDDDDAISSEMIAQLKADGARLRPNTLITYPTGLFLIDHKNESYLIRKFEPYIAIAWALVNAPGQVRNPYEGRHGRYFRDARSYMDPHFYAYIHVAHSSSDTVENQARKLNHARAHDTTYETERAKFKIAKAVRKKFHGFTAEELLDIISNAPGKKAPPENE